MTRFKTQTHSRNNASRVTTQTSPTKNTTEKRLKEKEKKRLKADLGLFRLWSLDGFPIITPSQRNPSITEQLAVYIFLFMRRRGGTYLYLWSQKARIYIYLSYISFFYIFYISFYLYISFIYNSRIYLSIYA